eukprot:COSAG05_NODE_46_length_25233_cov_40.235741_19_plen_92_part_00
MKLDSSRLRASYTSSGCTDLFDRQFGEVVRAVYTGSSTVASVHSWRAESCASVAKELICWHAKSAGRTKTLVVFACTRRVAQPTKSMLLSN